MLDIMRKIERKISPEEGLHPGSRPTQGLHGALKMLKRPRVMTIEIHHLQTGGLVGNDHRRMLTYQRALANQFMNPDMRRMPFSTAGFADGGAVAPVDPADIEAPGENNPEQRIVSEAMLALRGQHPNPEQAIQRFIDTFGEAEFRALRRLVLRGEKGAEEPEEGPEEEEEPAAEEEEPAAEEEEPEEEELNAADGGYLYGPGTGQQDQIKARLSPGEYVVDAPTVAMLGDGSNEAGARRLDELRKRIREMAYGHSKQAKPLKKGWA